MTTVISPVICNNIYAVETKIFCINRQFSSISRKQIVNSTTLKVAETLLTNFATEEPSRTSDEVRVNINQIHIAVKVYMLIVQMYVINGGESSQDLNSFRDKLVPTLQEFTAEVVTQSQGFCKDAEVKVIRTYFAILPVYSIYWAAFLSSPIPNTPH